MSMMANSEGGMDLGNEQVQVPPEGGVAQFGDSVWNKLVQFAQLLESEGQVRGLVGPREMAKLWDRHILNSMAVSEFIDDSSTLADVGAGAGFPGVVVAIVRPDVTVTLIETMERRCDWLRYVTQQLGLRNVVVLNERAENVAGRKRFDYVTARAVAPLKKLLPWCLPLVKPGGSLVALKGGRAEIEVQEAETVLRKLRAQWVDIHDVSVWGSDEGTRIVQVGV